MNHTSTATCKYREMTKILTLLILFFGIIATPLWAGGEDQDIEINKTDENGLKQGLWIIRGKDIPSSGYPAEGKIEEGVYKDDRKEGVWIKYYNDGITPELKGEYLNNRPNGPYEKRYPNGALKEKGTFDRNQYSGSIERYYDNGQLMYKSYYSGNGQEDGSVKFFYPNGQEKFSYEALNGIPTGKATRYWPNGDVKEEISIGPDGKVIGSVKKQMVSPESNAIGVQVSKERAPAVGQPRTKGSPFMPNGYNKVYNLNDEIWQDGDFRSGALWNGKLYVYDEDGILLKVRVFKNGYYNSDGQL
jgi:antitoxin component YwqK of YwqJK toxin-antitoxin module